ncbi:TPA: ABC transporter ATP-binding protein [Pseudomonas aeruginosa]|jgi:iron complex transport system ATP-binding protein|uniref:Putative ATP-binding component of ferric enterobactin transport n=3 Tax=Pseudomonas aeruginosa TaxID=287 RepID=A0A0H2Z6H8_PSEAB|nr:MULTISPECIES: ABC transporter ATP-binding protein [Pseudomonas]SAJ14601.1 iron-enterobactin transporter ATP-binding protein [Enterobacter cloacae]ABJ09861.1 putative ATP-binding component of ferric enterobactin transport [Pseudomonas aeruginosa UCBPP-PA14]ALY71796.1 iron dicitrate ABC transporter ATP-binding protein [Pseudomonas aeruginosa]ALY79844.1 iron dicitrate ABC transporter ATP-binding protein [Pseudomonas aeruginosa]ASM87413.1 iron dicitrate ABC transporter ATP-binding protein [Pseu
MTLAVNQLRLSYGSREVLRVAELQFEPTSMVCLIGPNGCGKSTLLRALAGLNRSTAGAVSLDGKPLASWSPKALARRLAFLPQSPAVPQGVTIRQLVAYGRYPHQGLLARQSNHDREIVGWAMESTGISHLQGRDIGTLSGGERQRAWIAMILAQESSIVLLDEPTTYLDMGHQAELMELLAHLQRTRQLTVVMVLHDLNQASQYADRLLALRDGRIVADGAPLDIVDSRLSERLFGLVTQRIDRTSAGRLVPYCLPVGPATAGRPTHEEMAATPTAEQPEVLSY